MRRMEKITGRSDDMMILRGVNVFPTQIVGTSVRVDLRAEGGIERSQGKAKRVLDQRK